MTKFVSDELDKKKGFFSDVLGSSFKNFPISTERYLIPASVFVSTS